MLTNFAILILVSGILLKLYFIISSTKSSSNKKSYPEELVDETRKAFKDIDNSGLDDVIRMKNVNERFGFTMKQSVIGEHWIVCTDRDGFEEFDTLEEMLDAGWIVD